MGQKPRRVRGAHAAKDSDYFLPRRVRGKKYFSACQCQRRAVRPQSPLATKSSDFVSGFLLLVEQLVQLRHEGVDVLELAVDAGEADVGHLVGGFQLLHDLLTDDLGAGLAL